jgi:hypothetical protein
LASRSRATRSGRRPRTRASVSVRLRRGRAGPKIAARLSRRRDTHGRASPRPTSRRPHHPLREITGRLMRRAPGSPQRWPRARSPTRTKRRRGEMPRSRSRPQLGGGSGLPVSSGVPRVQFGTAFTAPASSFGLAHPRARSRLRRQLRWPPLTPFMDRCLLPPRPWATRRRGSGDGSTLPGSPLVADPTLLSVRSSTPPGPLQRRLRLRTASTDRSSRPLAR